MEELASALDGSNDAWFGYPTIIRYRNIRLRTICVEKRESLAPARGTHPAVAATVAVAADAGSDQAVAVLGFGAKTGTATFCRCRIHRKTSTAKATNTAPAATVRPIAA